MNSTTNTYKPDILIVDDTPNNLRLLSTLLNEQGYKTRLALDGERALKAIEKKTPDLILLDVLMPVMDGYTLCQIIKEEKTYQHIPILFISALHEGLEKSKAFSAGGVDYITKPFSEEEVLARIRTHLDLKQSKDKLLQHIQQLELTNQQLEVAKEELLVMATTDPLTGLFNRRKSLEIIQEEQVRYLRSKTPFSFVIADVDNFKQFNDAYGHDCGDFVLTQVAEDLREKLRAQDCVGRWGGEEFNVVLPESDLIGAKAIMEKIRTHFEERKYGYKGQVLSITLTFGVSVYQDSMEVDALIKSADQALYQGKQSGKNRVVAVGDDCTYQ